MSPEEIERAAAFYRAAITQGILAPSAAVDWADDLIARADNLPSALYDVSLAPGGLMDRVLDALGRLISSHHIDEDIVRAVLDVIRAQLASNLLTSYQAITKAYALTTALAPGSDLYITAVYLEEYYSLAQENVLGNVEELSADIVAWLESFAGASANFPMPAARLVPGPSNA